ncbi:pyridoxamine 5'-phosphate oxidase family protein [Mycolicibacterium rhodesiae]|uniref:Pyridoxamine 5-phosphate oxidase n=1 Tax=Mycolicibacterium rhodesiae TaxID=36814 RepID=A0A1X0IRX2_MYCRH|nr:pyridoxamine 5'-phosphate oxidase family protein [Mycolicibacterium rhodesiae]MCV7343756.1 pyridoxamine 5'-phosphate oxidase family protein [Mycolicibacterium rhodesiae]ORB51305.1 pyridoxamine 5-phosphate oxidase [Mycolicibacterium rhodesiae]
MSKHYASIAFTDDVRAVQNDHGSDTFYARKVIAGTAAPGRDSLTEDEKDYLSERDGFYLASVSETGWPYVQFRGGKPGFIHVIDDHTIGWADFRGNLQYISTGNMTGDDRVAIIVLDYAHQRRLKLFGHARIVTADQDPELLKGLTDETDDSVVERAVLIDVEAYDWNCQQHITPRFSAAELEPALEPLRAKLAELQAENDRLRAQLDETKG